MRLALTSLVVVLLGGMVWSAYVQADFGLDEFDVTFANQDGLPATQAGSHPFAMTTTFGLNNTEPNSFEWLVDGEVKDLNIEQIDGLVGDSTTYPTCTTSEFLKQETPTEPPGALPLPTCKDETAIGVAGINLLGPAPLVYVLSPVYNLTPPPGVPAELGFDILGELVTIDVGVKNEPNYNLVTRSPNILQLITFFGGTIQLWGNPASPVHDPLRGHCFNAGLSEGGLDFNALSVGTCPTSVAEKPFLTLPTNCNGPQETRYEAESWQEPGRWATGSTITHNDAEPPEPQGFTGCGKLGFKPRLDSQVTTRQAETGSGLDLNVDFSDEGLKNSAGLAESQAKKAVVALPEGVTINPSVGEGLAVCTPDDYARETLRSEPGEGCPSASKLGSLHVDTPIAEEGIDGEVFLAEEDDPTTTEPGAENPFDSLVALYLVLRNTNLGALVKLPLKVEPDARTGQLVATLDNVPQFPFSHFNFHFREGARAPLVTPAACGTYTTEAKFWPWSDPTNPRTVTSSFDITTGKGGGACPSGGVPPFDPEFEAGSINNNAGSYSPFDMRLQREDGEQDMTKFSSVLPPGVLGSLAGVEKCGPYAAAAAKQKTGRQELADPSCPANSEIGHTLAGAGVGAALTYVPGKIYLGGPYNGDPLSVIAITPALAGPFDAGTVAVRLALTLNPKTAEVEVDGANSDPIPHILKGIVLKLRDLRVNVDRPNFILNPTNCDESQAKATLFGSYLDEINPFDDKPVDLSTRYQAANCLNLGFSPHLGLHLKGGTRRGNYPGLKAVYSPKSGEANIKGLVVRLPRSAFLEQGHIRTICTRVQFAAKSCPKAARYGYVKAWTPLLDEPLQGPVYLRSSNHKLPDMVLDLHGLVDVEVGIRIDSAGGGIRATMEDAPDATLSRVILHMQGGKKGLIVNSRNICLKRGRNRANVVGLGQNGKQLKTHPVMQVRCANKRSHKRHRRARVARSSAVS
jgi:hypothetical protein